MKRALFFVYIDAHFLELKRVAAMLCAGGDYEAVFLFAYRYPTRARDIEACREAGYRILDISSGSLAAGESPTTADGVTKPAPLARRLLLRMPEGMRRRVRALLVWLRGATPRDAFLSLVFPRLPEYLDHQRRRRALAETVFSEVSPSILVLAEDNVEFITSELIRAAHAHGVPSLIVPFTIVNAEEIAEAYWHNPDYSLEGWRNRLAGALYPKWVYEHRGRKLLPLPADRIVAVERLGTAPPKPWIVNSGSADAIAVEGSFMRDYYLAAGLPEAKLTVTGALYDDVLFEQMTAGKLDIRTELRLEPSKPILLCALPPEQFTSGRPGGEFGSYAELLGAWGRTLSEARKFFAVIVRPHPRMLDEEVSILREEYGLALVYRDTASLIPHCDLYVACVSATIRMAVAAGKPVLNYDCYRFRYQDYVGVPGVVTVEDAAAFARELKRLGDEGTRDALASRQREFAARANLLDGRAHERMRRLVERLVSDAQRKAIP